MSKPYRVAHFSDLHVLALEGVPWTRFLNKRLTGYANMRFKRSHVHSPSYVRAIAREITRAEVDHVVITGDITNLALETEFEAARALLEKELGLHPRDVTIVPGNHDLYTRGAQSDRRFSNYFAPYLESDLPDLAVDVGVGRFPVVKLRGPAAFIGLSSAVPRLPLVAAGSVGAKQRDALAKVLAHPEVKKRVPVVALHHPLHNPPSKIKAWMEGLRDADALAKQLAELPHGLVVYGHLHRRQTRQHATTLGHLTVVAATSASLLHEDPTRMAGFNVYAIGADDQSIAEAEAHVFDRSTEAFRLESIPVQHWS